MARGWESKSVEEQKEAAESAEQASGKKPMTAAQIESQRTREGLLLCRAHVVRSLENCENPRYKAQLEEGLADLEKKLAAIG